MPRGQRTVTLFELMGQVNQMAGGASSRTAAPAMAAFEHQIEEAVLFLATSLEESGKRGKKPVLMHSLRVGSHLLAKGCAIDVVIAGLLHDILEKTNVAPRTISRRFGAAVAMMVSAATNRMELETPLLRYEDSLRRCAALGEGALMVRIADLVDNCDRLMALGQVDRLGRLSAKISLLLAYGKAYGLSARQVADLTVRQRRIKQCTGTMALLTPFIHPESIKGRPAMPEPKGAERGRRAQGRKK